MIDPLVGPLGLRTIAVNHPVNQFVQPHLCHMPVNLLQMFSSILGNRVMVKTLITTGVIIMSLLMHVIYCFLQSVI